MSVESVGFVGWRGMVGSVLLERMRAEGDFAGLEPTFYSTSQVGQAAPDVGVPVSELLDAYDITAPSRHDAIVSCQGGDYTKQIDAASAKRMDSDSVLVLDPVNRRVIDRAIDEGLRHFIGGNCTVSLMLMGLHGLFEARLVEWMTCMTYQAASGSGARHMRELIEQMRAIGEGTSDLLETPSSDILPLDRRVNEMLHAEAFPVEQIGVPLAGSLLP